MSDAAISRRADEVVLAARNIAKSYNGVKALKGVNFDVHRGQVTTLFGENGAGKSTLMKILSGVVTDDDGETLVTTGTPVSMMIEIVDQLERVGQGFREGMYPDSRMGRKNQNLHARLTNQIPRKRRTAIEVVARRVEFLGGPRANDDDVGGEVIPFEAPVAG